MTQTPLSATFPETNARLEDIYDVAVLPAQRERYAAAAAAFEKHFGRRPDFFARSPGRVNLIGEHIDYAGYSVLPMAIDRDVVIATAVETPADGAAAHVALANIDSDKYHSRSFDHDANEFVIVDSTIHEWSNYFKCGYKGAFEAAKPAGAKSVKALVSGTVPAGAGVSSSSAFVCASAVATLTANDAILNKGDLVKAAIRGEHYAGVQTGGMDQSISIMGLKGSALIIHFFPGLSAVPIAFPKGDETPVFVIANTLVTADKHVTAPTNYNLRVVETRLGAALLAKKLGVATPEDGILTFRQVQDRHFGSDSFAGNEAAQLNTLLELVDEHIDKKPYSLEGIAAELGLELDALKHKYIGSIVIRADDFKIYARAKHVFSEARRVFLFRDACASGASGKDLLEKLGHLMNDSQTSCRDLFNCSCPEIDELTEICRRAGAYGSRLTGAGWGGCTVSLVAESRVADFIEQVKEQYYFTKWPAWKSDSAALARMDDYIFASKPGVGAAVVRESF
ncbi:galactokinase [Polyrhizophydium stewartii]|uniref:Galactokinase n=1 Tax=Polyrhizophydium stewartii TaxID=2732419 RepID=A0ABR4NFY6_9FUNG|nr:galactokinase [Polyrhizophydium stewartii]